MEDDFLFWRIGEGRADSINVAGTHRTP
jgi:hypothetical protein